MSNSFTQDEIDYLEDLLYCEIRDGLWSEELSSVWHKVRALRRERLSCVITNDQWIVNLFRSSSVGS